MADICIVTAWDKKMDEIGKLTWSNRVEYCEKHGYRWCGGLVSDNGPWLKIGAIRKALSEGNDLAIWIDADAIITNLSVAWENVFHQDLVFSHDVNGINAGVLFCRNTPWMMDVLDKWEAKKSVFKDHPMPEQNALAYLLYSEPKDKWLCVPQKQFNCFRYDEYSAHKGRQEGNWSSGDFLLHLPGMDNSRRREILTNYLNEKNI